MIGYLIFGATYAFAAAMQPGPFQTYIISRTLSHGWKHTLAAAFSPILSDIPIVTLTLLLLSQLGNGFYRFLHFGGGLFLFYLAWRSFMTWRSWNTQSRVYDRSGQRTLWSAALVNLLNPNPYIGWSLIMGPLLLKGWKEAPINGIALIVSFYVVLVFSTAGIIILFALAKNLGPRVNRIALGLSALGLACFGVYQMWLGFQIL